jgi:nitrogen fixation protein FixH
MANNSSGSGKYWPYMILGFLFVGLFLGFWTVQSAISMPVSESNAFQKKYQDADVNINRIIEAQQRFNAQFTLEPVDFKLSDFKPREFARKHGQVIALTKTMRAAYRLTNKQGQAVNDANVTFLLTRPQTRDDDQTFANLPAKNGVYATPEFTLPKAGRYTLRLRVQVGDAIAFMEHEAYLKP